MIFVIIIKIIVSFNVTDYSQLLCWIQYKRIVMYLFLNEIRLGIDSSTEKINIVEMKSYGLTPMSLMAAGYEQVRSIVKYLPGDYESTKKWNWTYWK